MSENVYVPCFISICHKLWKMSFPQTLSQRLTNQQSYGDISYKPGTLGDMRSSNINRQVTTDTFFLDQVCTYTTFSRWGSSRARVVSGVVWSLARNTNSASIENSSMSWLIPRACRDGKEETHHSIYGYSLVTRFKVQGYRWTIYQNVDTFSV